MHNYNLNLFCLTSVIISLPRVLIFLMVSGEAANHNRNILAKTAKPLKQLDTLLHKPGFFS